jgi:ubiquinone/menaquinone biosynthesis C-methylase UbiE
LVVDKLGNISGKVVADIGAGTGYFTFRLAPMASKVIAIDVENRFLEYIEDRKFELGESGFTNKIETRLCLPDDPLLANNEVNVVLIVNTYHFIKDRIAYLRKVHVGMKDGGELVLVDFKHGKMSVGPMESVKVPLALAEKELIAAGFKIEEKDTTGLQFQYIIKAIK